MNLSGAKMTHYELLPPSGNISPFGRKRYVRKYKPFRECSNCFIHEQCIGCNQSHQNKFTTKKKLWQLGYCFHFRCFISTKCCFISEGDILWTEICQEVWHTASRWHFFVPKKYEHDPKDISNFAAAKQCSNIFDFEANTYPENPILPWKNKRTKSCAKIVLQ